MTLALVKEGSPATDAEEALDRVFFALSDPVRRAILRRLDEGPALVSELAAARGTSGRVKSGRFFAVIVGTVSVRLLM